MAKGINPREKSPCLEVGWEDWLFICDWIEDDDFKVVTRMIKSIYIFFIFLFNFFYYCKSNHKQTQVIVCNSHTVILRILGPFLVDLEK